MEDVEEALLTGNSRQLITHLRMIEEPEVFRSLIDQALDLQDFDAVWYIVEVGNRYDEDLDNYLLERCGINGQTLPCKFFQNRGDATTVLKEAVATGNVDLLLYAIDLLYTSLDPAFFEGYSSQDYEQALAQSQLLRQRTEKILSEASPSFLDRVSSLLPAGLLDNLILRQM